MKIPEIPAFFGRDANELAELFRAEFPDLPNFRAKQVYKWLYAKRARSFEEMTDLPRNFREKLVAEFAFAKLHVVRVLLFRGFPFSSVHAAIHGPLPPPFRLNTDAIVHLSFDYLVP